MSLKESKVLVEAYRSQYNHQRQHGLLAYMTPVAFATTCLAATLASVWPSASPTAQPQEYRRVI